MVIARTGRRKEKGQVEKGKERKGMVIGGGEVEKGDRRGGGSSRERGSGKRKVRIEG